MIAARPLAPRPARVRGLRLLSIGGAVLLSAGCQFGEMASHNLDVVMSAEDRLRYVGDLQGPMEYLLRGFVDPTMVDESSWLAASGTDPIGDPTDVAVENLLTLSQGFDGNPRWREAEEVRQFARYAVACPAGLARERALLELIPHGQRLALTEPFRAPEKAANAEELRVRLEGLVEGARGLLVRPGEPSATALADFRAACALLAAAEVDIPGGRRVLRAVAPFLSRSGLPKDVRAALVELSESLQRRLVTEALARGLLDPLEYVRAAAVRANVEVYGDPFVMEATFVLGVRPVQELLPAGIGQEYTRFGVLPEELDAIEPRVALCRLLAERGLPAAARQSDARGLTLRFGLMISLVQVATRYDLFEPRARTHAMLALDAVTGARLGALREDAWDAWWRAVGPELQAAAEAQRKREAEAPPGALKNSP